MRERHFLAKGINVSCRTIDGFAYIYLEDQKELFKLDEIGTFIWNQINGRNTVREVVVRCLDVYDGNEKEITKSVKDFIGMLMEEGMVVSSMNVFEGVMQHG